MSEANGSTSAAANMDGRVSPDSHSDENYRPPAPKTVEEILKTDTEDQSLQKYKELLLGSNAGQVVVDASNPKNVLVRSMTLMADNRPELTMTLNERDLSSLEKQTFSMKEGCMYRLRIDFHVQREIVAGMKYVQKVYRHGLQVDKDAFMVGSYGPKEEVQSYKTPPEEAPSGMLHRGTYKIKSLFTDDDKNEWLAWTWTLEIKKDWE